MRAIVLLCVLLAAVAVWWFTKSDEVAPTHKPQLAVVNEGPVVAPATSREQSSVTANASAPERTQIARSLLVRVRDADGQLVEGAELVQSTAWRNQFPDCTEKLLLRMILGEEGDLLREPVDAVPMPNGQLHVPYDKGAVVTFAVRVPGHSSIARAYRANDVPASVDLQLNGAGSVLGTIAGA